MISKNKYLAFVLSEKSRAEILSACPPSFEKTIAHHVTLFFTGSESQYAETISLVGKEPLVEAVGCLTGAGVEAILISINGKMLRVADDKIFHCTLSLSEGHKPVESNALIDKNWPPKLNQYLNKGIVPKYRNLNNLKLTGKVQELQK
jgi:hypothetical protein